MHQLQGNKEYGSEKKGYLLKKSDGYVLVAHNSETYCYVQALILVASYCGCFECILLMHVPQVLVSSKVRA